MAKRKHSADWMLARVREYLSGKGSYRQIARANGISERSLRDWVRKYEEQGEASFIERAGNASYSKEFKASCVLAALRGEGSVDDIVVKYNISSHSVLRHWMKWYEGSVVKKLYLSAILDLYDRSIVAYVISGRNDNKLVFNTFE